VNPNLLALALNSMTLVSSSQHPLHFNMEQPRRHKKMLRDGTGEVWPDAAEILFSKAIQEYDRQSAIATANSHYPPDLPSRNEFIVRYLQDQGLTRTKQQVASHIQQLKKRSSKELAVASAAAAHQAQINLANSSHNSSPSPSVASIYQSQPSSPALHSGYGSSQSPYSYSPSSMPAYGSYSSSAPQNPIATIVLRYKEAKQLTIPIPSIPHIPMPVHGAAGVTITAISLSHTGYGLSLRVRIAVPPHEETLSYIARLRLFAYVVLSGNPAHMVGTTALSNKIHVNGTHLLEDTDHFVTQGQSLVCPLRLSPQASIMVAAHGSGMPLYPCVSYHRSQAAPRSPDISHPDGVWTERRRYAQNDI
jgi:hypothetical protein